MKNVLITGATGGIGLALVKYFHENGYIICATGTNSEKLNILEKTYKDRLKSIKCDLSESMQIDELVRKTKDFYGTTSILINNAGITKDNLLLRMKDEEWNEVINLNLTSSFLLSKYTIKKMLKNKNGKIINITSIVGHTGNIGQANYAASKAGMVGMSKSLALEYGKKNININCISPGFIKSEMTDKISEDFKKTLQDKISLDRFGEPEDVANAVIFLSSSLSDYITGETIHVNGGMYFS